MKQTQHQFTIIGAGIAGMAAAEFLQQAGCTPHIIEAAAEAGGRCATGTHQGQWFDYGAQYFTARAPLFQANVQEDLTAGRLVRWQPGIARAEQVADTWLLTPSPDPQPRLVAPEGLQHWMNTRLAMTGLPIARHRIVAIQAQPRSWQLDHADGHSTLTSNLICTPPAIETASLFGSRAWQIPPLNQADPTLLPCHACLVSAPPLRDHQAIFFDSDSLIWAADNTHKAGRSSHRHLWMLHSTPEFSQRHRNTPAGQIAQIMMQDFAAATARDVATMTALHCHYWSHARPGDGAMELTHDCWADPQAGLAIAGDWLAGGRIEGAWLSGRAAARQLAAS